MFFSTDSQEYRCDITSFIVTKKVSSQLLDWYANRNGSSESITNDLSCGSTIRSQILRATKVCVTGLRSYILRTLFFLGAGTMQESFHVSGTTPHINYKLKIVQNISRSRLLHILKTFGELPSGPASICLYIIFIIYYYSVINIYFAFISLFIHFSIVKIQQDGHMYTYI